MWKEFLESQKAGWRNYAEYVLTPGVDAGDVRPIDDLKHEMEHFGQHLLNVNYLLLRPPGITFAWEEGTSALNGLSYVPRDNFPIRAHEGEAVLNKKDAQEWRGGGGRPSIGVLKVFIGNQEIKDIARVEADGVIVARNQRGVNTKQRVYQ